MLLEGSTYVPPLPLVTGWGADRRFSRDQEEGFSMGRETICKPITRCGGPMCRRKQTPDGKDL
jgi:hypothetical protein